MCYEEIGYLFKYMEKNGRSRGNPWSARQTGIVQRILPDNSNMTLILNPHEQSRAEIRLNKALYDSSDKARIHHNPVLIHLILLSSYFGNWRMYLQELGQSFEKMASKKSYCMNVE